MGLVWSHAVQHYVGDEDQTSTCRDFSSPDSIELNWPSLVVPSLSVGYSGLPQWMRKKLGEDLHHHWIQAGMLRDCSTAPFGLWLGPPGSPLLPSVLVSCTGFIICDWSKEGLLQGGGNLPANCCQTLLMLLGRTVLTILYPLIPEQ